MLVAALALFVSVVSPALVAQEEVLPEQHPDEGKTVVDIAFEPDVEYAASLISILRTKVSEPLRSAAIQEDLRNLWRLRQVRADQVFIEDAEGGVRVIFSIVEQRAFDRLEFRGLEDMTEREALTFLGITPGQRINRVAAEKYALSLRDRYQRRGYAFVDVTVREDPDGSTLILFVDEGPKVTVEKVSFRGNASFPSSVALGLMQNLIGSSGMKSKSGWLFGGEPYSDEIIEEDLDRLRFFYRKQGYRDARVELAAVAFTRHREAVELQIRVIEGRRYTLSSVEVERYLEPGNRVDPDPLYPAEDILERLSLKAGDPYDQARVDLDKLEIEEFYGERGHPSAARGVRDGFRVPEPIEVFDTENATIRLIYRVIEGSPKRLRDVIIRGNTETKDFVVRRKVFLFPGDLVDTAKLRKSERVLNSLRYFQDATDPTGVRYELLPVDEDPDLLDVAWDVQEGDTGQFLWGAGVSTAAGVQGRFQFTKRNFDITRVPSSWNPITMVTEVANGEAFHGAGQNLELLLSPGSQISLFQVTFSDPDIFRRHFDTIGFRVDGFRRLQFLDSFRQDALGANIALSRAFTEEFQVSVSARHHTVDVRDIDDNAPTIVYEAEGTTELRGMGFSASLRDVDNRLQPSDGYRLRVYGEMVGGLFGGGADFWKAGVDLQHYSPLYRDTLDRAHVFRVQARFDYGEPFGGSENLYLTERFYMGGSTLRGFDQREAGPSQFGQPLGGQARYLTTLEYQFPLVSTRRERSLAQNELLRGVLFTDLGLLGLDIGDTEFSRPRLSIGFGLRVRVPVLEVPIALDLAWPVLDQNTDEQQHFFFSLSRF